MIKQNWIPTETYENIKLHNINPRHLRNKIYGSIYNNLFRKLK